MSDALAWPIGLGLLGLVFGSFIATVAIRWPQGRSALSGRSTCDGCGQALTVVDLVPLVSWLVQRGRCRRCGGRIAPSHPLTEAVGMAIGVTAALIAPGWDGVVGAAFGWLLLALAAIDAASYRLPDVLTGSLAVLGLATGLVGLPPPTPDRLIGGLAGLGALLLVAEIYRRMRGRIGLGRGDAKLFGAIGLWLGWRQLPPVLLVACGIGLAAVAGLMLAGRRVGSTDRLAFGPCLCAAAFILWCVERVGTMS